MKWFKFYGQDFLTDPKMLRIDPLQRLMWVTLLCLVGDDENGEVKYLEEYDLQKMAGCEDNDMNDPSDLERTKGTLDLFESMNMIERPDENTIRIVNYKKRQEKDLTNAERQARYREKHNNSNGSNVTKVTLDKNRIDKNRKDDTKYKERDVKRKPIIPPASPSGSPFTKEEQEIFNTPEDREFTEKAKQLSNLEAMGKALKNKGILLVLFFFFFVFPVHAETISLRYTVSSPLLRPAKVNKLIQAKDHSLPKKPLRPDQPSFGGSPTITPYPKFLTEKGAKTRDKVLSYLSKYYSGEELTAADNILKKEAGYRYDAVNEIGCAGMVQACPASKLPCSLDEGGVLCQADFFIGYVNRRYGSPTKAWEFHQVNNWY